LVNRYYLNGSGINGFIREEMKVDKNALEKISAGLKSQSRRLTLIDKVMTIAVAKRIDEAVGLM